VVLTLKFAESSAEDLPYQLWLSFLLAPRPRKPELSRL